MAERYPGQRSEYGGGDGQPQRGPDGALLPIEELAASQRVSERARLMRTAGMHDYDPAREDLVGAANTALPVSGMSAAQREAYEKDLELSRRRAAERAALNEKTNGYLDGAPDSYTGDGVV
jgi:hypothetical protein